MNRESKLLCIAATVVTLMPVCAPSAPPQFTTEKHTALKPTLLVSGLEGSLGSAIGPDGALYVPEGTAGRIARIDVETGAVTTFASGLPKSAIGVGGGAMDIAFLGETAYVLITLVNPLVGGNDIDGIYRVDGPNSFTVVADIGRWSVAHPPKSSFELKTGSTYAMETYRGELLVTDSHLNRVLRIKVAGCVSSPPPDDSNISELVAFDDIVPTGLAISGHTIYMAEAGPLPHLPKDSKIVEFEFRHPVATEVASGARLLVDVETGPHHHLYGLSDGIWGGGEAGDPNGVLPNTGSLVRVNDDGGFTLIADHLDRPTSLEFIGNTAYYVSLAGEVWKIEGISCGHRHH